MGFEEDSVKTGTRGRAPGLGQQEPETEEEEKINSLNANLEVCKKVQRSL